MAESKTDMMPETHSPLRRFVNGWLAFAHLIGTVQMVALLTVVYWVFIPLMHVPFGLIADPLRLRRSTGSGWREREVPGNAMEYMTRQW